MTADTGREEPEQATPTSPAVDTAPGTPDAAAPPPPPTGHRWRTAVILWLLVMGLAAMTAAAVIGDEGRATDDPERRSGFRLSDPADLVQLPTVDVPTNAALAVVTALAALVAVAATVLAVRGRKAGAPVVATFAGLVVAAFLVWAVGSANQPEISLITLLNGSVLLSVPLVFGAMSGVFCERAGVINISIEGQLLAGAFAAAVTASLTGSVYVGLVSASLAGLLVAWLLAVFAIRFLVDQIVLGVVINVLVIGLTSFLSGQLLVTNPDRWNQPDRLQPLRIPVLADIPIVGSVLFDQTLIVYAMYVLVAGLSFALFRTRWGLRVRAVGEHPKAADTAGINVNAVRFRSVLYGGLVAGLGGAFYTIGRVGAFGEEMTAGQGFIALAALIFGRWTPTGALLAALLFGFANNLQSTLSIIGTPIPGEILLMAPYLVTILAVAGFVGRVRAPAADGKPYQP